MAYFKELPYAINSCAFLLDTSMHVLQGRDRGVMGVTVTLTTLFLEFCVHMNSVKSTWDLHYGILQDQGIKILSKYMCIKYNLFPNLTPPFLSQHRCFICKQLSLTSVMTHRLYNDQVIQLLGYQSLQKPYFPFYNRSFYLDSKEEII